MFASALKSFSSNITSNYTLSPRPTSHSGLWKIHDAKQKSTGKAVSVFVFDRKALDTSLAPARSGAGALKKVHDEAVERLRKEASSLARLRHPSILELVEPVEETRNGGLIFATEQVSGSLAGMLSDQDSPGQGGPGGRASSSVADDAEAGGRRRRELEIDELEIQKGLLQLGKALEFLHDSAALVHGNLTPEAVFVNAKSDWKLSGLAFSGPADNSTGANSGAPISLAEVLHHEPRLPRSIQLNLDYTSPDFVMDSNVTPSADMFSLGLFIIALYNSPRSSPIQTNNSSSTYKRLLSSSSTIPNQNNRFLSSRPLPDQLSASVLPRLITRRPAQRMTAREFQQSPYFDNILVSSIRFLDSLPAKTPNEKAQFMRGLPRVLPQFPKPVLEKKVLPALLEELKDRDLLSLILPNVFKIVKMLPAGRRAFTEKAMPRLKEVFLATATSGPKGAAPERDSGREAGLMIILENMTTIIENCSAKDFKTDMLPILSLAIESPNHALVDASFRSLPTVLPALDFTTVKNELFPKVAAVFTKTSSLGIKVRGLEAFTVLCGGSASSSSSDDDGLDGMMKDSTAKKGQGTGALDKYTIQEKMVPLLKAIKTKEPAVMMASLKVLEQVGRVGDFDFVAMDVLPLLWSMALGPLLNLQQFQLFMDQIKRLSTRVEQEQTKKLQELSSNASNEAQSSRGNDIMSFGNGLERNGNVGSDVDFERLVLGKPGEAGTSESLNLGWTTGQNSQKSPQETPMFAWSTPAAGLSSERKTSGKEMGMGMGTLTPQAPSSRSITPDLSSFTALTPSTTGSQTLAPTLPQLQAQGQSPQLMRPMAPSTTPTWPQPQPQPQQSMWGGQQGTSSPSQASTPYGAAPPSAYAGFSIAPPPPSGSSSSTMAPQAMGRYGASSTSTGSGMTSLGMGMGTMAPLSGSASAGANTGSSTPGSIGTSLGGAGRGTNMRAGPGQGQKQGLDRYESLL